MGVLDEAGWGWDPRNSKEWRGPPGVFLAARLDNIVVCLTTALVCSVHATLPPQMRSCGGRSACAASSSADAAGHPLLPKPARECRMMASSCVRGGQLWLPWADPCKLDPPSCVHNMQLAWHGRLRHGAAAAYTVDCCSMGPSSNKCTDFFTACVHLRVPCLHPAAACWKGYLLMPGAWHGGVCCARKLCSDALPGTGQCGS